ncbi:MAG: RagB/SusD family nutrient uptake outer membrane protein [Bacteroidaceae bacterium]|nr:RagB/SusD family nutrient uptake outer membrane protein [Bacteroidaceae bacterium]
MKIRNIFSKLLLAGGLVLTAGMTSCEDYLTIMPTDQITEEDFWNDKNDLDNVRAAAYKQMISGGVMDRAMLWGEVRSDNMKLNNLNNTSLMRIKDGILQPTDNNFDWSAFYKGINYCNKVLEYGEKMAQDGRDPSFGYSDWYPIKAEMLALRAVYYFHLVRAYRNVPYVETSISTDAEAMRSHLPQEKGVNIIDTLIVQLEGAVDKAAENYGTTVDNKGRFTKRSIKALLADLYMWEACMLNNSNAKGDSIANADTRKNECLDKVIEYTEAVLNDIQKEYEADNLGNTTIVPGQVAKDHLDFLEYLTTQSVSNMNDEIYAEIFGKKNSKYESILEWQYDGTNNQNSTLGNYVATSSGGAHLSPSALVAGQNLYNSALECDPTRGFGKTDIRLLQTIEYKPNNETGIYNLHKCVVQTISFNEYDDMTEGAQFEYRNSSSQNANWPVYRVSDMLLLKAEAIARRYTGTVSQSRDTISGSSKVVMEAFDCVNTIFKRNNPTLKNPDVEPNAENKSDRLKANYHQNKTCADLLSLVYNERQREFACEGKRWYDLVRQAEWENSTSTVLKEHLNATTLVSNRLKSLWSFYNPVHADEMKISGAENGGYLIQNPVWERYSK